MKNSEENMKELAECSNQPTSGRAKHCLKSVAEEYMRRVWDDKDLQAIEDLIDQNAVIHSLLGDYYGSASMKSVVQAWLKGFPDLHVTIDLVICENDLVSIQWRAQGTHLGEFKGKKPTNKTVSYGGATVYRIRDEKIVEYWAYLDMHHLLNQL